MFVSTSSFALFQNVAVTQQFQNLHLDSVLSVKGVVSRRPPGHENTVKFLENEPLLMKFAILLTSLCQFLEGGKWKHRSTRRIFNGC